MNLQTVKIDKPEDVNLILGQTHFIKSVEDLHEAMATSAPGAKFGVAFCEASGARLIRRSGNDDEMLKLAVDNLQRIAAGHTFLIMMSGMFPIHVMRGRDRSGQGRDGRDRRAGAARGGRRRRRSLAQGVSAQDRVQDLRSRRGRFATHSRNLFGPAVLVSLRTTPGCVCVSGNALARAVAPPRMLSTRARPTRVCCPSAGGSPHEACSPRCPCHPCLGHQRPCT